MKRKVLLVVPSLEIGGRERIAVNTAEGLIENFDVEMAIFQERAVNRYTAPCNVINLNVPVAKSAVVKVVNQLLRSYKLFILRKQRRYDYVISFGSAANTSNALSGIGHWGKTICAIHGFSEVKKSLILTTILKRSDRVICIAKAMHAELMRLYPKCKNSIVIENGYILKKSTSSQTIQKSHNNAPVFVSMGRLEPVKGFDILLKAFQQVHDAMPAAQLWLIGDGSQREELEREVQICDLGLAVKFWGYQKEPHAILENATVYVLSSRNEGLPNALIEALNAKLPVVSIDCESGPREIITGHYEKKEHFEIEQSQFGVLVENFQDEAARVKYLAKAMLEIVEQPDLLSEYRKRAPERAFDYSLDVYIEKMVSMLALL